MLTQSENESKTWVMQQQMNLYYVPESAIEPF